MSVKDMLRLDGIAGKAVFAAWKNLGKGKAEGTFRWKNPQTGEERVQKTMPGSGDGEKEDTGESKKETKIEKTTLRKLDVESKTNISNDLGSKIVDKIKEKMEIIIKDETDKTEILDKPELPETLEDKEFASHKINKRQITKDTMVSINSGEKTKYGDLSDEEQKKVLKSIESGKVKHKGFNDYNKTDVKTFKENMNKNLEKIANDKVEEKKNVSTKKVSEVRNDDARKQFMDKTRETCQSVIDRYAGKTTSKDSKEFLNNHLNTTLSCMDQALKEGSLAPDVTEADLDEFIREDIKRMFHQEMETKRRSVADHGIRHLASNTSNTIAMLDSIQKYDGSKVNGKLKLMAVSIQANHDLGYTVGDVAYDAVAGKKHKNYSGDLAREERGRYEKIFGKDGADIICGTEKEGENAGIIQNHDSSDYNWEKNPLGAAVALADCTSLFGKDKIQDLFIRNEGAMDDICKIRMLMDTYPKLPKEKDFIENKKKSLKKKDLSEEETAEAKKEFDNAMQEDQDNNGETQRSVIDSQARMIKQRIHDSINEADYDEYDKTLLHQQVSELDMDFSSADILSRYSGVLQGFKYDPKDKCMNVSMKFSPESDNIRRVFGDDIANRQFEKMAGGDLKSKINWKSESDKGKYGETDFIDLKTNEKRIHISIEGFDDNPINQAVTNKMKNFLGNTIRDDLRQSQRILVDDPPKDPKERVDFAKEQLTKDSEKLDKMMSPQEKENLNELFKKYADNPSMLLKALKKFPLLEKEQEFLMARSAMSIRRGSGKKIFATGLDELSKEDRNKLLDMVKDKLLSQSETPSKTAANNTGKGFKDKDLMEDTGGKSKVQREPHFKPKRRENKGRYKNNPSVDNSDTVNDKDLKLSGRRMKFKFIR